MILNRMSSVTNILSSKVQSARKILLSGNQPLEFIFILNFDTQKNLQLQFNTKYENKYLNYINTIYIQLKVNYVQLRCVSRKK